MFKNFISTCEDLQNLYYICNVFSANILFLAENKYANYAYQCLLQKVVSNPQLFNYLSYNIYSNFYELSMNQYGYHIVEFYIDNINRSNKKLILNELIHKELISHMYTNKYSRYVLNKVTKGIDNKDRMKVIQKIENLKNKAM